ncbi:hypothetical protein HPB51_005270 [Rhipicephalus microplus]|uniref:Uncharacterized protein n=1 Tax=Rhipicephalus microplus TaxID=6941 RepID=A0A9J6ERL9_RHIMP|nr:hypothetical protein HPB51_005270 [Rhipicephalus microplus]
MFASQDPQSVRRTTTTGRSSTPSSSRLFVMPTDMVFTDVFVGFPGRAQDARVLEESFLFEEAASRFDGFSKLGRHLTGQHLAAVVAYERKQMRHCYRVTLGDEE